MVLNLLITNPVFLNRWTSIKKCKSEYYRGIYIAKYYGGWRGRWVSAEEKMKNKCVLGEMRIWKIAWKTGWKALKSTFLCKKKPRLVCYILVLWGRWRVWKVGWRGGGNQNAQYILLEYCFYSTLNMPYNPNLIFIYFLDQKIRNTD